MLRPIALLWLASPALGAAPALDVQQWAHARGLEPRPVAAMPPAVRYDAAIVSHIETLLDEARRTAPGPDSHPFAEVDRLLAEHPELPQAAWLFGERLALQALLEHRRAEAATAGPAERSEDVQTAASVTGRRSPVLGEPTSLDDASDAPSFPIRVRLRPEDQLLIDGAPYRQGNAYAAGRHHLQLLRAGVRLEARWLDVDDGATRVTDPTRACSPQDFLGTGGSELGPLVPAGVTCGHWLAASLDAGGRTVVATCHGSSCGPWALAAPQPFAPSVPSAIEDRGSADATLPSWLTWAAVGAGAVLTTGLLLWRAGAFDGSGGGTEFVFTGPTAPSLRF